MFKKIFGKKNKVLIGAIILFAVFFAVRVAGAQGSPVISNGSPTGVLANTAQVTLSVNTDKNATCRYSTVPGTAYGSMADTFSTTGQAYHSQTLTPANGKNYTYFTSYTYYIRCVDVAGNEDINDYAIVFSIAQLPAFSVDTSAPSRFSGRPTGSLPAGTSQTVFSISTDKNATCRYSTSAGTDYDSMANVFSITGQTAHYQNLTNLVNGYNYAFYVRCADATGHKNADDYAVIFSVDRPSNDSDINPPVISGGQPTGTLPAGTNAATLFVATNENAHCEYSTVAGMSYDAMANIFSVTNGTSHSKNLTGLVDGRTYTYFVRCADSAGNTNPYDYVINFSVAGSPAVSIGSEVGEPQVLGATTYNFGLVATLVKASASSDVYAISNQTKRKIFSLAIFNSYAEYWQNLKINNVSSDYLNSVPDTTLIKTPDDPKVYILSNGFKRPIASAEIFNSYGWDWDKIVTINQAEMDSYASTLLIKHGVDLYRLNPNGVINYFPSMEILMKDGYNVKDAVEINDFEFKNYVKGTQMI